MANRNYISFNAKRNKQTKLENNQIVFAMRHRKNLVFFYVVELKEFLYWNIVRMTLHFMYLSYTIYHLQINGR